MTLTNAITVSYDTRKYDFRAWASLALDLKYLEKIHERVNGKIHPDVAEPINASHSLLVQAFDRFKPVYVHFIQSVIAPIYNGINSYQVPPSFRFHLSKKGSRAFYRDRSYDGSSPNHLNVWIPFTRVWGSNSIWIESEKGKGDFAPAELEYGQALIFDGINLRHGTFWNGTSSSRLSMEFRFSPHRDQEEKKRSCVPPSPIGI
jgi:hypothetical protein